MKGLGIELDLEREMRLGFDEAVYAAGKSIDQLDALIADALATKQPRLFTRLGADQFTRLLPRHRDALVYNEPSRIGRFGLSRGSHDTTPLRIAVVSAGSSDAPVAQETMQTLAYYRQSALYVPDVGVAGLWRLLRRVEELRAASVVIVVAGMEGALTSVVGGLVPGLVIAVPTSVGYGVSAGGQAALTSALSSCAPGILTVNIDNGYGAACAALRVANLVHAAVAPSSAATTKPVNGESLEAS